VVGHDEGGALTLRLKWSRGQVKTPLANVPPLPHRHGGLRGSASSQPEAKALGHDARIMLAKYVRPFLRSAVARALTSGQVD